MSDTPSTPADQSPVSGSTAYQAGLPPPPPISAPSGYRPISGFAIAGLLAACLFALLVVGVAAVALVKGEPFFYPAWVLLLPATALVLSLVARSQIRSAEGTRAGEGLAKAGIWISLFTGLGYIVYDRVTGLAVTSQANDFLMEVREDSGFFPHLKKAANDTTELYAAFLLSMPPTQRGPVRPEDHAGIRRQHETASDGGAGSLAKFRDHPIVRMCTSGKPGDVTAEPLGVQTWEYENRSYTVRRLYRIVSAEAQIDFSIPVVSYEGETAGEPRKWFVALKFVPRPSDRQVKLSKFGEGLRVLRYSAQKTLAQWQQKLNDGESFDLVSKDRTNWESLAGPAQQCAYARARLQDLFRAKERGRLMHLQLSPDDPQTLGGWKKVADGKMQIQSSLRLRLDPRGLEPPFTIEGRIVLETKQPVDPETLPNGPADFDWEIQAIEITRAAPAIMSPDKKGGPP